MGYGGLVDFLISVSIIGSAFREGKIREAMLEFGVPVDGEEGNDIGSGVVNWVVAGYCVFAAGVIGVGDEVGNEEIWGGENHKWV